MTTLTKRPLPKYKPYGWQDRVHRIMHFAGVSTVTFVDKYEQFSLRVEALGQVLLDVLDEVVNLTLLRTSELVHE